ncbi:hypothetical protein SY83_10235 [Paenibacillus swuensis]|uniref:ABC transporter substrate-binding protein n=1 Tax=Paenibacillus swuensis TaxID=1178515 RepID=A0A172THQ6_9BACL|nr:extracellular solute-binding protein [Paenibacillus swuensis]ANE46588.1 hypothetical protein SY83_10235 [Paenibacillus swuensis]
MTHATWNKSWIAGLLVLMMLVITACSGNGNTENAAQGNGKNNGNQAETPTEPAEVPEPFGMYKEPVELKIGKSTIAEPKFPEGETWADNEYYRHLQKTLNISVKHAWEADGSSSAYKDKVNLSIASNDLPDAFSLVNRDQLAELVKNDMIEDLTEVYEKYVSPEYKAVIDSTNGQAIAEVTVDGKMFAIPTAREVTPNLVWVRQDWLDTLKLQAPKSVDDVLAVAKAFKAADLDKTGKAVGLTGVEKFVSDGNEMHGYELLFNAYELYPMQWTKGQDGTIAYGGIQPGVKDVLAKLAQAFKDGLIDREFATKDAGKANEVLTSGQGGIAVLPWWAPGWPLQDSVKNSGGKAVWKAYPIIGANGKYNGEQNGILNSMYVVRKGYEHPEALVKLVNWEFKLKQRGYPELNELMDNGIYKEIKRRGTPFEVNAARMDEIQFLAGVIQQGVKGEITKEEAAKLHPEAWDKVERIQKYRANPDPMADTALWADDTQWTIGAPALVAAEQNVHFNVFTGITKGMENKKSILDDLLIQSYLKIIYGEESVDYFDTFVEQWKSQGGDEITKEVQEQVAK